ncbi:ribosomal-protein-alanine N-acetyltransferase [Microvenator marinus]|uniref:[Ribosomal protein bS18]-alanine N-acetyltransferase n=1 Tax=Microvenator marinus TaxID=2600177 RepID=A0A5B8XLB6_9DELT|nr:ribosomal protein S18-alanine N-acetyltransferase [Microvenator marinus]QED25748.1 ribosomal-protein-alanine N-acetyltransferase [Microvenator marinus]
MILRAATETDLDAVHEIESESQSNPWSLKMFQDELHREERGLFWVVESGAVLGFAVFDLIRPDAELLNVSIRSVERGKGCGRHLLEGCLLELKERGFERVLLEVRSSNAAAIGLYSRLGFQTDGKRANYYDHPKEDAILMSLGLCG